MKNGSLFRKVFLFLVLMVIEGFGIQTSIRAYLAQPAVAGNHVTMIGKIELGIFAAVCLLGLFAWFITFFRSRNPQFARSKINRSRIILVILGVYLVTVVLLVYASSLRILTASWFSPLFFAGMVMLVIWMIEWDGKVHLRPLTTDEMLWGSLFFLMIKALMEFKLAIPGSILWKSAYFGLYAVNCLILIGSLLAIQTGARVWTGFQRFYEFRKKYQAILWLPAVLLICFTGWWFFFHDVTGIGSGLFFRLEALLVVGLITAVLVEKSPDKPAGFPSLAVGVIVTGYAWMVMAYLSQVTNYPLALGWSEGNRLYDYSLIFGKSLYKYTGLLNPNYFSPGRYGLWGLPFLIPGLPVWVHRLWNAILYFVPGVILGWLLVRDVKNVYWKIAGALGVQLFLNQGPVYPSLTIALILPAIFMKSRTGWRVAAIALASLYAGLSRFTWVLVTGAWVGLIDLFLYYPARQGSWYKKLLPTVVFILVGILPGMAVSWPEVFQTQGSTIQSQPLLWYRLFPSATYPLGILLGLLLAAGAALIYVFHLGRIKEQKLDVWQILAVCAVLIGFLGEGLIASTKIGGGSNLHNLDMFLFALVLVFVLLIPTGDEIKPGRSESAVAWNIILAGVIIIPAWSALWGASPLVLPDRKATQNVVTEIQKAVDQVQSQSGQALFMDQRQLLTFGQIKNVTLIPDYEKKYMMDQAMAGNEAYFESFYADLKQKRFGIIISDTLRVNYQNNQNDFNEENNAWVKWVSEPFLEYYQPLETFKDFNTTIYVPK
jgi:hypothetical protein